jgi:anaerobic magnesium-protoporphyrin IX monomethyl ester cyclase
MGKTDFVLSSDGNGGPGKNVVILIYPRVEPDKHHHEFPLSVLALAPWLLRKGYRVEIIDERVETKALQRLSHLLPEAICVGVSSMTGYQIDNGIRLVKEIRRQSRVPVVWGGWHVSLLPEESIRSEYIDVVVRGQGEETFSELVDALAGKGAELDSVRGITYMAGGKVVSTPDRPIIPMDRLDPMPFELVNTKRYYPHFTYISSTGCPMACGFCADAVVYKRQWHALSPERMLEEVAALKGKFTWRVRSLYFIDNNFFVNVERVRKFCQGLIDRKIRMTWEALGHPHQLARFDDDTYRLLRESGCYRILVGAESGSQEILDYIGKRSTVDDLIKFLEKTKKVSIIPVLSMICGFPQAPLNDLKDTVMFINEAKRINPRTKIKLFFFTPYPGSRLYDIALANGFKPPTTLDGWSTYTLNRAHVDYLDPDYERFVKWFVERYYPRQMGREKLKWETILADYKKSTGDRLG